jgi:CxxC motif-containing protein (DUF1111 family)
LNTSGNDGTITRFGWKAQNKSLEIFAAEAYNVEQGVSNEGFQNERAAVAGCIFNATPEDHTSFAANGTPAPGDVLFFAGFMRFAAPPTPAPATASTTRGATVFNSIGCNLSQSHNRAIAIHRYVQRHRSSLLRFCAPSHGSHPARRRTSR